MEHALNFDERNHDELESIIHYIGETSRGRKVIISRENFDKLPIIRQICQTFPPSTICTSYIAIVSIPNH